MIQLFAYKDGVRWQLDTYEEEPIKLTISAEEITIIPAAESSYSRQFRIPATQHNSQFFEWWYELGVIDFDITKKVRAEIHVDGLLFKTGELRIQAAYVNKKSDQIDLELVFYGETRDFATEVGEVFLNQLDVSDGDHILSHTVMHNSQADEWNATRAYIATDRVAYEGIVYRCILANTGIVPPNATYWVATGDWNEGIYRYALAIRGYEYDSDGVFIRSESAPGLEDEQWGQISFDNQDQYPFTQQSNHISYRQYTPFIQVKYLLDKIFARTSYTYSDDSVFNEAWFKNLYIDGIADVTSLTPVTQATVNASSDGQQLPTGIIERLEFPTINEQQGNAYNATLSEYTVGITGTHGINVNITIFDRPDFTSGVYTLTLWADNTVLDTYQASIPGTPGGGGYVVLGITYVDTLTAGQKIYCTINCTGGAEQPAVEADISQFKVLSSPAAVYLSTLLKTDVTAIDLLKSILTRFRLVLVPSLDNERQFVIKPWVEYIGTGEVYDWSKILDLSKDVTIKPLFFEQSALIDFTDLEDNDRYNELHQEAYNYVYGRYLYDSQNQLLTETRKLETIFAPTPVNYVPGSTEMIVPWFAIESQDLDSAGKNQILPMLPKTRLLFWNSYRGLTDGYFDEKVNAGVEHFTYPVMSTFSDLVLTEDTLDLNWKKDIRYFDPTNTLGTSIYTRYWKSYVNSLYSKDARIITAYFMLDAERLRYLTFDDVIFISGQYYRVQKIYDAPIAEISSVKVDLVKLLDWTPTGASPTEPCPGSTALEYSITVTQPSLSGGDGSIIITPSGGIGPYIVRVTGPGGYDESLTVDANIPAQFSQLVQGTYVVTVTDSCETEVGETVVLTNQEPVYEDVWLVRFCDDPNITHYALNPAGTLLQPGQAVKTTFASNLCFEVVQSVTNVSPQATITDFYNDCQDCAATLPGTP